MSALPLICVYAIAKNEAGFARRFMQFASEADAVVIGDTGSEDETRPLFEELGATVIDVRLADWRFDAARNCVLDATPTECEVLCAWDIDEVAPQGWTQTVREAWHDCNQLEYTEVWSHRPDGSPERTVPKRKIHNRDFIWRYLVHEVLVPRPGREAKRRQCDLTIHHWPDQAKPRSSYLPLLERAVQEDPESDRLAHYYARELYFYHRWPEAIREFQRHLSLSGWDQERAASMRYLAECHAALGQPIEAERWHLRACAEAPCAREPWLAAGAFYLARRNWEGAYWAANRALAISERSRAYTEEERSWREGPHDLLAVAAWYMNRRDEARKQINRAIVMAPFDPRLQRNHALIEGVSDALDPEPRDA